MVFRKALVSEKQIILDLYNSVKGGKYCVWDDYPGIDEIENDLRNGLLYVLEDGQVIGTISIEKESELEDLSFWGCNDNVAEFARVAISKAYQGRGLSSELVSSVEKEIASMGKSAIHILVAKKNIPAYRLYMKAGYKVMGDVYMYGDDYYACEKILK